MSVTIFASVARGKTCVNPGTGLRLIAVYDGEQLLPPVFYSCFAESFPEVIHELK